MPELVEGRRGHTDRFTVLIGSNEWRPRFESLYLCSFDSPAVSASACCTGVIMADALSDEVLGQQREIVRVGLEGEDVHVRRRQPLDQQRIPAHVGADVDDDVTGFQPRFRQR